MLDEGSVTLLLGQLRAGEPDAAADLCARYFTKLVEVARARLPVRFRRAADEEDVAQSALRTFVRRATAGEFPGVATGRDLWGLLARITINKALKLLERECRQKRGSGRVPENAAVLEELFAREPSPDMAAQLIDLMGHLLARLDDPMLQRLAKLRLQNHTEEEMAAELNVSARTIRRKLDLIRRLWEREID